MPYAPAIHIVGACDLMFISGATASPLYHHHPHRDEEHINVAELRAAVDAYVRLVRAVM